jgi:hypothetical protein
MRFVFVVTVLSSLAGGCSSGMYYTVTRGRPDVYSDQSIRRVAVLGFNDELFTGMVTQRLLASKWEIVHRTAVELAFKEMKLAYSFPLAYESARNIGRRLETDAVIYGYYTGGGVELILLHIDTGEVRVNKTIVFEERDQTWMGYNVAYTCHYLIPWRIKQHRFRSSIGTIWTGNRADIEN